jgi:hypothetical protein
MSTPDRTEGNDHHGDAKPWPTGPDTSPAGEEAADFEGGDEIIGGAIPVTPPKPSAIKPDLTAPWHRPAKQYLRREQWNAGLLQLLNRLPKPEGEQESVIRYVGLPGQYHLDVLSMGGICNSKRIRLDYLGFRTGGGPNANAVYLEELSILSRSKYFTKRSVTYPDSVENIGRKNTVATIKFDERGPFDIINLDVCGGILHGDATPLLNTIKYVLTSQTVRQHPWLLYITTAAKCADIVEGVINKFFSAVGSNFESLDRFKEMLASTAAKYGLSVEDSLAKPNELDQGAFLRFFTLAFGKWLLGNLDTNMPPSSISVHSVFCFRNTGRDDPEMLSLAYIIIPIIGGGVDPTGLTGEESGTTNTGYVEAATALVGASIDGLLDLDEVWDKDPELKERIVEECERLFKLIGADEEWLADWRRHHGLV